MIKFRNNSNEAYYMKNGHGDITQTMNTDGSILKDYSYDAFGNQSNENANDLNPFRYCGEYFDDETGNIYLRARYYNPSTGRFLSEDPIMDGLNWYSYCSGNPVMRFDPSGKITEEEQAMFENGEMSPMAYTHLMNLTYSWILSEDQESKDYYHQLAEDFRKTGYTTTNGLFPEVDEGIAYMASLPTLYVNKEEHFFRNKLNIELSYSDLLKINEIAPDFIKWELLPPEKSELHQNSSSDNSNLKYVSKDGHFEVVYDKNGNILSEYSCPIDMGTYNYASPHNAFEHGRLDVSTYYLYGGKVENSGENPKKSTIEHYWNKGKSYIDEIFGGI